MFSRHIKTACILAAALALVCITLTACSQNASSQQGGFRQKQEPVHLRECELTLDTASFTYNATTQRPAIEVRDARGRLLDESSYSLKWHTAESKMPGAYTVTAQGMGNFTGKVTKTYKITRAKLGKNNIKLSESSYVYNGKKHRPKVTVTGPGGERVPSKHLSIKWKDSKPSVPGTYRVTVKGKGPYTGSAKLARHAQAACPYPGKPALVQRLELHGELSHSRGPGGQRLPGDAIGGYADLCGHRRSGPEYVRGYRRG